MSEKVVFVLGEKLPTYYDHSHKNRQSGNMGRTGHSMILC